VATAVADWLEVIDEPMVLNVNVPTCRCATCARRTAQLATVGTIQSGFVPVADGHLQLEIWEAGGSAGPGTDAGLVRCGYVAVTELQGLHSAPSASVDALPTLIEDTLLDAGPHVVLVSGCRSARFHTQG